jgi:6-phospho-beta-glucosidase
VRPAIAILGGSTPFTAALVEALRAASGGLPAAELRLFGQDAAALERMRRYGERRLAELDWTVSATPRLEEGIADAAVVVNQVRFGGLEGRSRDEALAARFGLPADETLGPCGLSAALRVVPPLRRLAAELGRRCPDAWVLNLANPLSLTTAALVRAGAPRRCVGLCELPLATVRAACGVLGVPPAEVAWDYAGLNHRGFVVALAHRGEELLPRLPALLGERTLSGVSAADIREAGALPLKYFHLSTRATRPAPGRARFLGDLKDAIARELDAGAAPPPSLGRRDLSWYDGAVVPMIAAIFADEGRRLVVNALAGDGLVRERPARVWRDRVEVEEPAAAPPPGAAPWLLRWEAHERALLAAVERPAPETLSRALAADPAVPPAQVAELAAALRSAHVA